MQTPYQKIEAVDPKVARHLLEATGHVLAPHRDVLTLWCKRMGVSIEELDAATREFRTALDRGQRAPHPEYS